MHLVGLTFLSCQRGVMKPVEQYESGKEMRGRYRRIRKQFFQRPAPAPASMPAPVPAPAPAVQRRPGRDLLSRSIRIGLTRFSEANEALEVTTIESIMKITCREFGINRTEFLAVRRSKGPVLRRFIAIGLAVRLTRKSLPQIGEHFDLDHSSVIYAARRISPVMEATRTALPPDATIPEIVRAMRCRLEEEGWLGRQKWNPCDERSKRRVADVPSRGGKGGHGEKQ